MHSFCIVVQFDILEYFFFGDIISLSSSSVSLDSSLLVIFCSDIYLLILVLV